MSLASTIITVASEVGYIRFDHDPIYEKGNIQRLLLI